MSLRFFGNKQRTKSIQNTSMPEPPVEVYGFANRERLNTEHYVRHALEMGYKTQLEYEAAAIEFGTRGEGKAYYSWARNRFFKYIKISH